MQNKQNDSVTKKVGDKIERWGDKLSNAGADKAGQAVYNAGDKIEHLQDKKQDKAQTTKGFDKNLDRQPQDKKSYDIKKDQR